MDRGDAVPRDDVDLWLEQVTERLDPFMAWLGVVFALLVGYELAVELTPRSGRVLEIVSWSIWGIFLLEFVARLWLAPSKRRFLRRSWFQIAMLAIPTLRLLRFARLVRLGRALPAGRVVSASYRSAGTARRLLRSRLGYLGALATIAAIGAGEAAYVFERDHPDAAFGSFADAIVWSTSTVLALQADPVPQSRGAQIVMLLAFAVGIVLVASIAGTVGAYLVDERRERAESV